MLVLLVIASGLVGLFLGRTFRTYALVPAMMLLLVPAWYLGHELGFAMGVTAFVASAVTMQVVYFVSLLSYLLAENLSVLDQVQSEASPSVPEFRAAF